MVVAMDGAPAAQRVSGVLAEAGLGLSVVEEVSRLEPAVLATGIHRGFVTPALGFGVLGLKGPAELKLFRSSLLNHLSYGFGLWWIAKVLPFG